MRDKQAERDRFERRNRRRAAGQQPKKVKPKKKGGKKRERDGSPLCSFSGRTALQQKSHEEWDRRRRKPA